MRSPADRRWLEGALRLVAVAAKGALLWLLWRPAPTPPSTVRVAATHGLPSALAAATRTPVAQLDLVLDSLPGLEARAWARSLMSAGTPVRWRLAQDRDLRIAATVEPLANPSGRVRLVAVGAPGASLAMRDAAGAIDSAKLSETGVRVVDATVDGAVLAALPGAVAAAARRDSVILRPVLVLARAGWEGKFVVAALEEAGWEVEARFSVAPQVAVRQGGEAPIDTARYAAVVALDSSVAPYATAIARFVRDGGGAVIAAGAARVAALAAVVPARPGAPVTTLLGAFATANPRRALGGVALTALQPSAVVLERSGSAPRVVAVRADAGRVLMLGYADSWRWRMEGGDDAPAAHRAWWSELVSSVAYAPLVQLTAAPGLDESPYAALVDALGAPAVDAAGASPVSPTAWEAIFFALLVAALLAEWGSRRLRGAR